MRDATVPYPTLLARFTPTRPLPFWRGQAAALATVVGAMGLRWALEPVLGDDVSFTTLFPALLVSAMLAGLPGAVTTIVIGSIGALTLSALGQATPQVVRDAVPRLVVWLLVGCLVSAMALALRTTIVALRRRQLELSEAKARQEVLTRELEHRGRNALTIVQALSSMTARSADSVEAYRRELSRRIVALSGAYALLVEEPARAQPLGGLVRDILAGFGDQIRMAGGEDVLVPPRVCVSLALALHELATNAVKYGALAQPDGWVDLAWECDAAGALCLTWREHGGRGPQEPGPGGAGSQIIRQAFLGVQGAEPEFTIGPAGASFSVRVPLPSSAALPGA
ncbi:MAG TPA: HWE histidine kinase domain-containing protein [Phenylobacterium sp.]|nr:HWE histidine kinase domain-containing protein [Phenylobacterium sp.]